MSFYTMLQPCYVPSGPDKGHWVHVPRRPIEVDDEVAAPLVEDGSLQPYRPGGVPGETGTVLDGAIASLPDGEAVAAEMVVDGPLHPVEVEDRREAEDQAGEEIAEQLDPPKPRRGRRRTSED